MAWIEPKTDWVDGDYFNVDPDYTRIKGNIEYLIDLSFEMYPEYDVPELKSYQWNDCPTKSFFNDIVNATRALLTYCYTPKGTREMVTYSDNDLGWNAKELNAIETNHALLYKAFIGQKSCIHNLELTLGGVRIGN